MNVSLALILLLTASGAAGADHWGARILPKVWSARTVVALETFAAASSTAPDETTVRQRWQAFVESELAALNERLEKKKMAPEHIDTILETTHLLLWARFKDRMERRPRQR